MQIFCNNLFQSKTPKADQFCPKLLLFVTLLCFPSCQGCLLKVLLRLFLGHIKCRTFLKLNNTSLNLTGINVLVNLKAEV